MRKKHLVIYIIFALVLYGCALTSYNVGEDYILDKNGSTGLLVFSLSANNAEYMSILVRSLDGNPDGFYPLWTQLPKGNGLDWKDPPGRLIVVPAPAGKYEIYDWSQKRMDGASTTIVSNTKNVSIQYQVHPSAITYIGNIHLIVDQNRYRINITNRKDRDLGLLLTKYPNLRNEQITVQIAEPK